MALKTPISSSTPRYFLSVIAIFFAIVGGFDRALAGELSQVHVFDKTYAVGELLGKGYRGEVYAIRGQPIVAKVSHADLLSLQKLHEEVDATRQWENAASGQGFSVPRVLLYDAKTGVAIKELVDGETLAAFLIRHQIMQVEKDGMTVTLSSTRSDKSVVALEKIWRGLENMLRLQREGKAPAVSLSPNNIMVTYADEFQTQIKDVVLVDLGPSVKKGQEFAPIRTLQQYLEFANARMGGYIKEGIADVHTVSFSEAQKDPKSLTGKSLTGEELRVFGLSHALLAKLETEIQGALSDPQATLYFYGSRVMPRTEVMKRDPKAQMSWSVMDDGVAKDSIRISGVTRLSDLDVLIISKKKFMTQAEEDQVRRALQPTFRSCSSPKASPDCLVNSVG